jgi:hypothetical protein
MKESYECEVATHIGPESCGAARKGGVEALAGERAGRVFSRVRDLLRDADAVGAYSDQVLLSHNVCSTSSFVPVETVATRFLASPACPPRRAGRLGMTYLEEARTDGQ